MRDASIRSHVSLGSPITYHRSDDGHRLWDNMQTLSLLNKKKIVDEYRRRAANHENTTQPVISQWAKDALQLQRPPNQSTISRIIKNADKFASLPTDASASSKRNRPAAAPRLERALFQWLCHQNNKGVAINGDVIKFHAERLLSDANALLCDDNKIELKFSKGWLERFKKRYNVKCRRVHGESMS